MLNWIELCLSNPLLKNAIFAAWLGSLASGLIGPYIVVKRLNLMSGTLAHTLLGGVGLGLWLNRVMGLSFISPLCIALLTSVFSACLLSITHIYFRQKQDAIMSLLWSTGMAAGLILISKTPGSNLELSDYLFGNILWVSEESLFILVSLNCIIIFLTLLMYKQLFTVCFDEDHAKLHGLRFNLLYTLLLIVIALVVVILMETMGILLAMTLLTIPALIASSWCKHLKSLHIAAIILSLFLSTSGMLFSASLDWPVGATIALISGVVYTLSLLIPKHR